MTRFMSTAWMHGLLAVLALTVTPAFAQTETCGPDPAGNMNHSANYILDQIEGVPAAMHWRTGLVWKRCIEGESFNNGQCSATNATYKLWNQWAHDYLPQYFEDSGTYAHDTPVDHDLLASGAWRMGYAQELRMISVDCTTNPTINRTVFPDTPSSWVWSASPSRLYGPIFALVWKAEDGQDEEEGRNNPHHLRLVRGGQPFAPLSPSATTQQAPAGTMDVSFANTITLDSAANTTAWGGARIAGDGNPEFQLNDSGIWATQAIVKTGDTLSVRMDAPANGGGSHTATLIVRSGQTTGTAHAGAGSEFTNDQETTASFTVQTPAALLDAAIRKEVTHSLVLLDGSGDAVRFEIVATNVGPEPIPAAQVLDALPDNFDSVTWQCEGSGGGTCANPSGTGDIDEQVGLPVGSAVRFLVEGRVTPVPEQGIVNVAAIDVPDDIDDTNNTDNAHYQRCPGLNLQADEGDHTLLPHLCIFRNGYELP